MDALTALAALAALPALVGHVALWFSATNHLHATALPHHLIKGLTVVCHLLLAALPAFGVALLMSTTWSWPPRIAAPDWAWLVWAYGLLCLGIAVFGVPRWWRHRREAHVPPEAQRSHEAEHHDVAARLGYRPVVRGGRGHWAARAPRNEQFHVEVNIKELVLPRLDPALDGLSVVHLSDLHFTGTIDKPFFEEVARLASTLDADLAALTGDLFDSPECIDWFPDTLGRLEARLGRFYVLGNHDQRVGQIERIHTVCRSAGWRDLGGRIERLDIDERQVFLAGNELPWLGPASDPREIPPHAEGPRPLRLLLSHSPDQFRWARQHDFDLVLAGHTHGGQIRLPWVGAVVAPSHHGVRYACGTFHVPPTVMHVSRGVSARQPVRYRCRPEVTKLILRAAQVAEPSIVQVAERLELRSW